MTPPMNVIATAGHVDHGKSALVAALTGQEPDRLDAEHRRGLTIELGYCWTELAHAGTVAFVDVPGHERFVSTMLAGTGPVPAALLVVAADDPWMPQAAEHLAALDAWGISHAVVAITRSDLADPGPAIQQVTTELAMTSLAAAPIVVTSSKTGAGVDELRARLAAMVAQLPQPDPDADVRLWADRRFTVNGVGTVVTGTLPAGTVCTGDELDTPGGRVRIRGIQTLQDQRPQAHGVSRVALNLTGAVEGLERGDPLWTPDGWALSDVIDVRLLAEKAECELPLHPIMHMGATTHAVRVRPLDAQHVRLSLDAVLPMRVGDRVILRDPGNRRIWGAHVLDPLPPALRRRGAATARGAALAVMAATANREQEVQNRGIVATSTLRKLGVPAAELPDEPWLMSSERRQREQERLRQLVKHHSADPLTAGITVDAAKKHLNLPDAGLIEELIQAPLRIIDGRIRAREPESLPQKLEQALAILEADFIAAPFQAPTADRLRELGLTSKDIGAAVSAKRIIQPEPGIVLPPDAAQRAYELLSQLPQPFTTSQARQQLDSTRRVAIPLLDYLDRNRCTKRLPDDRREVRLTRAE